MNGHRQRVRTRTAHAASRALRAFLACVLLAEAAACGGTDDTERAEADRTAVQRVLDRQAEAVDDGDEDGFLNTVAPEARDYRAEQRRVFRNLERLPLRQWSYRVTGTPRRTAVGDGEFGQVRLEATAELSYRLGGYDHRPVTNTERLSLVRQRGTWYVAAELRGSDRQLWEQGGISLVRGERSLVLGIGQSRERLRAFARRADTAVTAVSDAWPYAWPRRLVLEVPGSVADMARLLHASPSDYADIAAVTTGEAGVERDAPADRVIVNPDAYEGLTAQGQQVVMVHEAAHVATRTHTSDATPLWLSEGLADWIGYRGTGRSPEDAAPELARAVRQGEVPERLPADEDFRFDRGEDALGRAYEGSWLACRLIARDWGESRLTAFYRAVGEADARGDGTGGGDKGSHHKGNGDKGDRSDGGDKGSHHKGERGDGGDKGSGRDGAGADGREAAVDEALRQVLGLSREEFTDRWRTYLREELG